MWKVDCEKLKKKIGAQTVPKQTWGGWKSGRKATPKKIIELEAKFNIDFKDYIIVEKMPQTMCERLKFLREINGFTQRELSNELGMVSDRVKDFENRSDLIEDRIFELNEIFGCRSSYFKKGGEPYEDRKLFKELM